MDELSRRRLRKRGLTELPGHPSLSPPGDLPTVREDLTTVAGMVTELQAEAKALDPPVGTLTRALDHLADAVVTAKIIAEEIQ